MSHQFNTKRKLIKAAVGNAFQAAEVMVMYSTLPALKKSLKDPVSVSATPNVIYEFSCNCGCNYVGRTKRRLGDRIKEHIPKWYLENKKKTGESTITKHLLTCTNPPTDPRNAFKIIRKARSINELKILEAIFIKRLKPSLCIQKEHVISLCLDF